MHARAFAILLALSLVVAVPLAAQTIPGHALQPDVLPPIQRWHEPIEIAFSLGVLVFGAALITLFTRTLLKLGKDWRTVYLRLVVLTVVVTAGLFALAAGYTDEQIAPMMGLLGTLVGYLLGREANTPAAAEPQASASAAAHRTE